MAKTMDDKCIPIMMYAQCISATYFTGVKSVGIDGSYLYRINPAYISEDEYRWSNNCCNFFFF